MGPKPVHSKPLQMDTKQQLDVSDEQAGKEGSQLLSARRIGKDQGREG
jgi:hypothetical protein